MSAGCSPAAWTARSAGWTIPCSPRCWGTPVLRDCTVLAIEGTHASGKTTLTHALAAYYRERGIHVACVEEPARHSPFIEEIVVHGKGRFDVECEADLFAAQLSAQLRAARQHTMIICDKTIANVLAYAWLVLPAAGQPRSRHPGRHGNLLPGLGRHLRRGVLLLRPVQPAPGRRPLPRQGAGPAARRRPRRPLHVRHRRPARHRHPAQHEHRRQG